MGKIGSLGFSGALLAALMLAACGTTQTQRAGASDVRLDPKLGVFIAVPKDPDDPDYAGAGKFLAYSLAEDLSKRGISVGIGKEQATQEDDLAAARKQGAGYLMVPSITDWQHHYTDIGPVGRPNSAGFTMTVIDTADGSTVRSDDLTKSGTRISFSGGGDPKDQVKSALEDYVDEVYPDKG
ncbi:MAG TPA: DUF4823 domain-containing protein [Gammaproteobacteria bacterium]|jgi:hypothetical protein